MSDPSYAIDGFDDREAELARLETQVASMRHMELPVYRRLGLAQGTLLDVGTGSGALARALPDDVQVTGIDVDRSILSTGGTHRRAQARAAALPFADGAFDTAIARLVFQHLTDPDDVAREMLRVARRVIIVDADLASLLVHPEIPSVDALASRRVAETRDAGRDPFIGRRLRAILVEAGARDVDTHVVTVTSDQLSRERFAEMMLSPFANWGHDEDAHGAIRAWSRQRGAFGVASLYFARGLR